MPVPGAFPRAGSWCPALSDGANGIGGATAAADGVHATLRPVAASTTLLGQMPAQRMHVSIDKARKRAGDNNATGSQPRRAPV